MPYNRTAFSEDYATETFYFPLSVQVEDEDSEDLYDVSSDSVRWFEDEIQEAIDDYQSDIEMEKYLCDDNADIQRKLISAEWGVETLNGELYGCVKLTLKEPLTPEETEQMRGEVTEQASDGYVQKNNMLKRNRYSPKNGQHRFHLFNIIKSIFSWYNEKQIQERWLLHGTKNNEAIVRRIPDIFGRKGEHQKRSGKLPIYP